MFLSSQESCCKRCKSELNILVMLAAEEIPEHDKVAKEHLDDGTRNDGFIDLVDEARKVDEDYLLGQRSTFNAPVDTFKIC